MAWASDRSGVFADNGSSRDHDYAVELLGWISSHAASWAAETTSLHVVLRARPDVGVQDR